MAAAWSDNAYSVNLAQIALMLPIGMPCLSQGSASGQLESVRNGENDRGRAIAAVGYPRGGDLVDLTGIEPVTS